MAKKKIKVAVVKFGDRQELMLRYTDPVTKKRVHKNAETSDPGEAERAAGRWEDELRTGKFKSVEEMTWEEFRDRFEDEYLAFKSDGYFSCFKAAFGRLEKDTGIQMLADVPDVLDAFELSLRRSKLSVNSVRSYLKHIKVALSWATERGLLELVKLKLPEAPDDQMKGRPLTQAEFDLMLESAAPIVGADQLSSWNRFLNGMWLSGLRRAELLRLSWDKDAGFAIDMSGLYPRFRIQGTSQKSRKSQYCAMAPDFAEWLLANTPLDSRTGHVFCPTSKTGKRMTDSEVGRRVAEIATAAEVFTDAKKEKPAGCHDFRRSFGTRWSKILMPADLKALMRHRNIQTTMKYYVTSDADDLAARMRVKSNDHQEKVTKQVTK